MRSQVRILLFPRLKQQAQRVGGEEGELRAAFFVLSVAKPEAFFMRRVSVEMELQDAGEDTREFSSVGLEHLLDMQEVAGSNPVAPTERSVGMFTFKSDVGLLVVKISLKGLVAVGFWRR